MVFLRIIVYICAKKIKITSYATNQDIKRHDSFPSTAREL